MLEQYLRWYQYALEAMEYRPTNIDYYGNVSRIIVTGMGGSGIVGDLLASIASDFGDVSIYVHKDFYTPRNLLSKDTFVLAISYSGNTLETISTTMLSIDKGARVGIVTSGGRLLELAKEKNMPYIVVRNGLVPRLAMPIMLIAAIRLLTSCGINLVPLPTLRLSIDILNKTSEALYLAKNIVEALYTSSLPVIVASTRYQALAFRFKNELNENSKMPAKVEIIPELFHNDIVGWEKPKITDVVILIDSDIEYENQLLQFYGEYLKSIGFKIVSLKLVGNIIERSLFGSLVAGIVSVYVAQYRGLEPIQTRSITMYKEVVKNIEDKIMNHLKSYLP